MNSIVFKFFEGISGNRNQTCLPARIRYPIFVLAGVLALSSCAPEELDPARYPLIPLPQEVEPREGAFVLDESTRILLPPEADSLLQGLVERWARDMRVEFRVPLPVEMEGPERGALRIQFAADGDEPQMAPGAGLPGVRAEAYELDIGTRGVSLRARGYSGVFYGLETLRQLMEGAAGSGGPETPLAIPTGEIDDAPRFRYRGVHLDVGRHFFPVAFIKRYLDHLAAFKMNVFHWHLTEDQGWRIQIRAYPRLTEVGSCRAETMVEKNFDPYLGDGTPYCGFYTQEEIREVVAYARERFITVIPEIEMPGHSVAALAAYPELACTEGPFQVATRWGVTPDIYCPTEETFQFLEGVLTEVMDLFPSPYIHIGGDEAPKVRWEESPLAQEVIRREGLADEHELQSWFIRRIEAFLNENGRNLIGWDEILEGGLAPNATVMSWRGMAGGVAAAKQGHDVIMSPNSHLYLDHYQGQEETEPLAIGGFSPLERVYGFEPVPQELSRQEARHILGAQGNVWTEYISTPEHVEYMLLPRLLALSEVVWSPAESRDWDGFLARMGPSLQRLDRVAANYRIPDVFGLEEDRLILGDSLLVELFAPVRDGEIRYTLTGEDPGPGDPVYQGPFVLYPEGGGTEIRARVVLPDGRMGAVKTASVRTARLVPATPLPRSRRSPGLLARVFPGSYPSVDSLPRDFSAYPEGVRAATVPRVEIPGLAPATTYGATLTGFIRIPRDGIYTFYLTSDDGSDLWVDGKRVVDNDGYHSMSERRGQAALKRGWHPLEIRYFQGGGDADVLLEMEGPHTRRQEVPAHWLARSATTLELKGVEARIAIDPGHPSETSQGASGPQGATEIRVNWAVAQRLRTLLEEAGYEVVLTKLAEDELVTNRHRAEVGTLHHADIMIRLHCDAGDHRGTATFYPDRQGERWGVRGPSWEVIQGSEAFAEVFHPAMIRALGPDWPDLGIKGDSQTYVGSRQGALTGSIFSTIPVLTVEMVVITQPEGEAFIANPRGQNRMARAIFSGIQAYLLND